MTLPLPLALLIPFELILLLGVIGAFVTGLWELANGILDLRAIRERGPSTVEPKLLKGIVWWARFQVIGGALTVVMLALLVYTGLATATVAAESAEAGSWPVVLANVCILIFTLGMAVRSSLTIWVRHWLFGPEGERWFEIGPLRKLIEAWRSATKRRR